METKLIALLMIMFLLWVFFSTRGQEVLAGFALNLKEKMTGDSGTIQKKAGEGGKNIQL